MIATLKDDDGKVIAFCEWSLRDSKGKEDELGAYVFVNSLWVHKSCRHKKMIRRLIKKISERAPYAQYAYWLRQKYDDRMSCYKRSKIVRS